MNFRTLCSLLTAAVAGVSAAYTTTGPDGNTIVVVSSVPYESQTTVCALLEFINDGKYTADFANNELYTSKELYTISGETVTASTKCNDLFCALYVLKYEVCTTNYYSDIGRKVGGCGIYEPDGGSVSFVSHSASSFEYSLLTTIVSGTISTNSWLFCSYGTCDYYQQFCQFDVTKTVSSSSSINTGSVGFGNATESYTDATVVVTVSGVVTSYTTYCPLTALSTLSVVPPSSYVYSPPATSAVFPCGFSPVPKSDDVTATKTASGVSSTASVSGVSSSSIVSIATGAADRTGLFLGSIFGSFVLFISMILA